MDGGDKPPLTREDVDLEYNSLRGEIIKRIELRQQMVTVTLTIAGVFLGVGITNKAVALVYPPIAYFPGGGLGAERHEDPRHLHLHPRADGEARAIP